MEDELGVYSVASFMPSVVMKAERREDMIKASVWIMLFTGLVKGVVFGI